MTTDHPQAAQVDAFFARHNDGLARQGSIASTWRRSKGRRLGPYYRLDVRDDGGRKCALYLGREGPLVDAVRARLAQLQHPHHQQQQLARATRIFRRWRRAAYAHLGAELEKIGLRLQGAEVRGFGRLSHALTRAADSADVVQEGEELARVASSPENSKNEDLVTNYPSQDATTRTGKMKTW